MSNKLERLNELVIRQNLFENVYHENLFWKSRSTCFQDLPQTNDHSHAVNTSESLLHSLDVVVESMWISPLKNLLEKATANSSC